MLLRAFKKPPSKRFSAPTSGMTMAWFHVLDSLWSSVRKVAGLSCPQYRGAENLCQARKDASRPRAKETVSEPLFRS